MICTDTMTIKKTLALLSASAAFVGNAYGVQSEAAACIPVVASMVTSLLLLVTVLAIAKNPLIATASALWWLAVCMSSILLPLSIVLRDVWFDTGLTGFLCLIFGLLLGYVGFVLWFMLPWEPATEDLR
jgi:uncharacterized membrane protein YhaH (DUF805 family)